MLCPLCGKPVTPGAAFCPHCGAAQRPAASSEPRPPSPNASRPSAPVSSVAAAFDADRKRKNLAIAVGGLLALIAALFGVRGLLQKGASTPAPTLQVRRDAPRPNLALPARIDPAPLEKGATKITMPADIEAWLKHLERCEKIKDGIMEDQSNKLTAMGPEIQAQAIKAFLPNPATGEFDDNQPDPGKFAAAKLGDLRGPWDDLQRTFLSVPAPAECQKIASDYNTGLSQTADAIADLAKILSSLGGEASADISSAKSAGVSANEGAVKGFKSADEGVTAICAKYETRKWFQLTGIGMSGSPLAMPGLGASGGGMGLPGQ